MVARAGIRGRLHANLMVEPVALIRPDSNTELVELLRAAIEQAERGDFTRAILIKLRADHSFAVHCVGVGSDLAAAGALAFAQHDLMTANKPSPA